jgi:glutamine amidotransferase
MCELLGLSCRQPARLSVSLQALAARSAPGHSARDGWGYAQYDGSAVGLAHLYREAAPASDSPLARQLAQAGTPTRLAIAHIRHATRGAPTLANTQPFVRSLAGRDHVFAHNGDLPTLAADPQLALHGCQPEGDTDSERAFCALLQRLAPLWAHGCPSLAARLDCVAGFAAALRRHGPANFLYSDGELLFAHGHCRLQADGHIAPPGLHLRLHRCPPAGPPLRWPELCVADSAQHVLLLASVPLDDGPWQPLAEGEVLALRDGTIAAQR